jgi:uncharacterized membrane protein (UPF0127 family)
VTFAPTDAQLRLLRIAITFVLCASLLSCVVRGADNPADPSLASVGSPNRTVLPGFSETRITVKAPSGSLFSWCLLLAMTEQQRQRGLMTVTDATLGGYDGMLFRWADADVSEPFYMRNTPVPLTVAYLDGHGQLVSAVDMAPCDDSADCPLYPAAGPYRFSIEVPQGGLARLHIEPGATVTDDKTGCG